MTLDSSPRHTRRSTVLFVASLVWVWGFATTGSCGFQHSDLPEGWLAPTIGVTAAAGLVVVGVLAWSALAGLRDMARAISRSLRR